MPAFSLISHPFGHLKRFLASTEQSPPRATIQQQAPSSLSPFQMVASQAEMVPRGSTLFISHGSPTLIIDKDAPTHQFLQSLGHRVPKPRGVVIVSAHWTTPEPAVTVSERLDTIYDFYGFPADMYKMKYPAPGSPDLARCVKDLLGGAGIKLREDPHRGLDHGAWVPLKLMFPAADIPVIQLSVQPGKSGGEHFRMGRALAPLVKEGYLVVGSGGVTHNMRTLDVAAGRGGSANVPGWAKAFDGWLRSALMEGRFEDVCEYMERAPNPKMAHPTPEHILPLHVALGAAGESAKVGALHDSWSFSTFSMACYSFTSQSATAES